MNFKSLTRFYGNTLSGYSRDNAYAQSPLMGKLFVARVTGILYKLNFPNCEPTVHR